MAAKTDPRKVELALQLAAINNGNVELTVRQLREQAGVRITAPTITGWMRGRYAKRYGELAELHAETARESAAIEAAEIAARSAEVTRSMVDAAAESIDQLDPRDRAPSARAMSQVHAAMTEKALLLRGQPTQRVSITELDEIFNELRSMGVVDAQVIEDAEPDQLEPATT
jgi:hypothetical protein